MKKGFTISFVCCFATITFAQNKQFVKDLEYALALEDTASSYSSVVRAAKHLEYLTKDYPEEWLGLYWAAHVYSQCAIFSRASQERHKYGDYVDLAQAFYDRAWQANKNRSKADESDLYALQSNIYGMRIGQYRYDRNWEKVGEYAKLEDEALRKAKETNPDNPMVWTLEGLDKLRDEATRDEGRRLLAEAIRKYEEYPPATAIHPRWGRQWIDYWLKRYGPAADRN